jgi:hypothetical protein
MMKIHGVLIVFAVVAAVVIGWGVSEVRLRNAPPVVAAVAAQERAKADKLQAEADVARSRADVAHTDAEIARQSVSAAVALRGWMYLGGGVALAVLFIGSAFAVVAFLNVRARVLYPNAAGQFPILIERRFSGQLVALDLSRSLGPLSVIEHDGRAAFALPGSEAVALQLATQAQAAGVLVGIASKAAGEDVVSQVGKVAGSLPAPSFASPAGDNLRLVYVKQAGGANSEAARDLADVREFIKGASVRGLSRRSWVGHTFASGHDCTRSRYDGLVEKVVRAGVIERDGQSWRLAVSEREALDAFGVGEQDVE